MHFLISFELGPFNSLDSFAFILLSGCLIFIMVRLSLIFIIEYRFTLIALCSPLKEHIIKTGFYTLEVIAEIKTVEINKFL